MRRSHDRAKGRAALHRVSAFAANSHLVLGQEGSTTRPAKRTAIPRLLEKLAAGRSLEGVVTIDAIACKAPIAQSIRDAGADHLLAVKGNQPSLQADIEAAFETADKAKVEIDVDLDKGHGRIETRSVSVLRQIDWLDGDRRFPGEIRFVDARAMVRVEARTELKDRSRFDVRYCITSSARSAAGLAQNIRFHWGIENTPHWTLDVTFQQDLSRVRKRHGAQNMALVRKFAFNKAQSRAAIQRPAEPPRQTPPTANPAANTQKPQASKKNRQLGRQQARRSPHDPTR